MSVNPAFNPNYREAANNIIETPHLEASLLCLQVQGYASGLSRLLLDADGGRPAHRFWIIDNSGSMNACDGNRLVPTQHRGKVKICTCTRWEELRECIHYHVNLAGLLRAPTHFELLNNNSHHQEVDHSNIKFSIASSSRLNSISYEIEQANRIMKNTRPDGLTPLRYKVLAIEDYYIRNRLQGKKVSVVIATDGLPTDDGGSLDNVQFVAALKSLQRVSLSCPIYIVIRLCTDDPAVVSFYNSLDNELEFPLEVLDDFLSEAKEVHKQNPWLNYALPLHRIRESGYRHYLLDLIDERPLTIGELEQFCSLLFDGEQIFPNPETHWVDFIIHLQKLLHKEDTQWNPTCRTLKPWVDIRKLNQIYSDRRTSFLTGLTFWMFLLALIGVLVAVTYGQRVNNNLMGE